MTEMPVPIKTLLSKKTIVSGSIGTLMAMAGGVYVFAADVAEIKHQINLNLTAIEQIKLNAVHNWIADLKQERREVRRELRSDPDDQYLLEDLDEVEDALEAAELVRECMVNPEQKVCQ